MTDTRVLIADDHTMVREGVRSVLAEMKGVEVVGEVSDGEAALKLARDLAPDVAVLDITMPGKTGIEITRELKRSAPSVRILILSMHDHAQYVREAVHAGADGYVLKSADPAELRLAVETVARGDRYFNSVADQLRAALRGEMGTGGPESLLGRLTPREKETLALVARGLTSKQIGAELGISPRTVERHRDSTMKKLDMHSVAELTRFALESGLVE